MSRKNHRRSTARAVIEASLQQAQEHARIIEASYHQDDQIIATNVDLLIAANVRRTARWKHSAAADADKAAQIAAHQPALVSESDGSKHGGL